MTGNILMAGCGALGSRIAMLIGNLPDVQFLLVDDDVVGIENIGTSAYTSEYIGMPKPVALATMMYLEHEAVCHTFLKTYEGFPTGVLTIDTFDNFEARSLTRTENTLHVGVNEDRMGAVEWCDTYTIPASDTWIPRGENPICTHHLGGKVLYWTANRAAGVIRAYLEVGVRRSVFVMEDGSVL